MRRLQTLLTLACLAAAVGWAQEADIRNPDLSADTPEAQILTQAATAEDPAQRISIYETYLQKYPSHRDAGYAYWQLTSLYVESQQFDKAAPVAEKLLAAAPKDVEMRHLVIRAYEGAGAFDKLFPVLVETKALAERENDEYSKGVLQYVEYSLYSSGIRATDPKTKIAMLDALREHFPKGQYAENPAVYDAYVAGYQQTGEMDKAVGIMTEAVESQGDNPNERYLYALAENALGKREDDSAEQYAERLVEVMGKKQPPEGVSPEQWQQQKDLFTAYGHFVLGRLFTLKENFREGRRHLLEAVKPMEAQGGQPYGTLAYFLGICYVKLDVGGDNIPAATRWMGIAAKTENPFQAEAKKTLSAIQGVR
jgi:tetratricopeptide (TPR) repeat protein